MGSHRQEGSLLIHDDVSLANYTSLRIGGRARHYCEPASRQEAIEAIKWAAEQSAPVLVLGKGSNVLVSDRGWPGLVVCSARGLDQATWEEKRVWCESGVSLNTLVRETVARGLIGIERMAGIPGTVGGAVIMNAGAFGQYIGGVTTDVEYVKLAEPRLVILTGEQMRFGYRTSVLKGEDVLVTRVRLRFEHGDAASLSVDLSVTTTTRKDKHPLDKPSCGSVFKNPGNVSAGNLIEQAGLKGSRKGSAEVSHKHANFIVNLGGATAEDFRRLVRFVQEVVHRRHGILLEPEVVFAGEFDEPLYVPHE